MHEIEILTRSGPIILMARTPKQLYTAFRRFVNPNGGEVKTFMPHVVKPNIHRQALKGRTVKGYKG